MSTDIACGRSAYVACSQDVDDRVEVSTNPDLVDPGFVHVSVTQVDDSNEVVLTKASALFLADQLRSIASSVQSPARAGCDGEDQIARVRFAPNGKQYCYYAPARAEVGDLLKVTTYGSKENLVEIVALGRGFYEGPISECDAWYRKGSS
jgi:hypothetical protein